MDTFITEMFCFILGIIIVFCVSLLMAFPLQWCWNYVMPYLFDLKSISWLHAWCMGIITTLLFRNNIKWNYQK